MTTANHTLPLLLTLFCMLANPSLCRAGDKQPEGGQVGQDQKPFVLDAGLAGGRREKGYSATH
jgi:hypothetical protein